MRCMIGARIAVEGPDFSGEATFEIGPATGLVTRRLAALGASPIVAIEPDARLAEYLEGALGDVPTLDMRVSTFEDVALEGGRKPVEQQCVIAHVGVDVHRHALPGVGENREGREGHVELVANAARVDDERR